MSHPVLTAAAAMAAALKSVRDVNPTFLPTPEKSAALIELAQVEAQLTELRLRLLADADDVAGTTGAHDAAAWYAHATRTRHEDARADLRLATALDRRWQTVALGLRDGRVNPDQAHVIARCLDDLPPEVDHDVLAAAETHLVALCETFGPRDLGRLGRRILEVVAPHIAEAAEARRLAALESEARRRTRLTLHRHGDGTTRLSGLIPDAAATRLATYLEAYAAPRQDQHQAQPPDPVARLPYPRRLGTALVRLLETGIDPDLLPHRGGDATTVLVTIGLDQLRADLAAGTLLDGDRLPGEAPTGDRLSAGEVRRLACTARVVPVVLGGDSEILDLGRARRLFSRAQVKAMRLRDRHCSAEGCDVPGTWCEAHHWLPWNQGGSTDLAAGGLLCSHHHHLVHDPAYAHERLPDGGVRFHRRT